MNIRDNRIAYLIKERASSSKSVMTEELKKDFQKATQGLPTERITVINLDKENLSVENISQQILSALEGKSYRLHIILIQNLASVVVCDVDKHLIFPLDLINVEDMNTIAVPDTPMELDDFADDCQVTLPVSREVINMLRIVADNEWTVSP